MLITLSGTRRGLNWIAIYASLLILFLAKYYSSYGELPIKIEILVCAIIASAYTTYMTIGLENTIQSMNGYACGILAKLFLGPSPRTNELETLFRNQLGKRLEEQMTVFIVGSRRN